MFCWFFRFMISRAADGSTNVSEATRRHIRHCASCREFYQTCQSLAEDLTREAAISNVTVCERLSGRILRAIPGRRTEVHKVGIKLWIAAAAACVALIVLIGALFLVARRDERDNVQPGQTQMADAIQGLRAVYEQVGQDIPMTWPRVIEQPLATEFESLVDDTESAVRFLVACVTVDISGAEGKSVN